MTKEYVTAEDIVIPAGSKVWTGWEVRHVSEHADVLVDTHQDMSSRLVFDLKDAIDMGVIKEVSDVHDD